MSALLTGLEASMALYTGATMSVISVVTFLGLTFVASFKNTSKDRVSKGTVSFQHHALLLFFTSVYFLSYAFYLVLIIARDSSRLIAPTSLFILWKMIFLWYGPALSVYALTAMLFYTTTRGIQVFLARMALYVILVTFFIIFDLEFSPQVVIFHLTSQPSFVPIFFVAFNALCLAINGAITRHQRRTAPADYFASLSHQALLDICEPERPFLSLRSIRFHKHRLRAELRSFSALQNNMTPVAPRPYGFARNNILWNTAILVTADRLAAFFSLNLVASVADFLAINMGIIPAYFYFLYFLLGVCSFHILLAKPLVVYVPMTLYDILVDEQYRVSFNTYVRTVGSWLNEYEFLFEAAQFRLACKQASTASQVVKAADELYKKWHKVLRESIGSAATVESQRAYLRFLSHTLAQYNWHAAEEDVSASAAPLTDRERQTIREATMLFFRMERECYDRMTNVAIPEFVHSHIGSMILIRKAREGTLVMPPAPDALFKPGKLAKPYFCKYNPFFLILCPDTDAVDTTQDPTEPDSVFGSGALLARLATCLPCVGRICDRARRTRERRAAGGDRCVPGSASEPETESVMGMFTCLPNRTIFSIVTQPLLSEAHAVFRAVVSSGLSERWGPVRSELSSFAQTNNLIHKSFSKTQKVSQDAFVRLLRAGLKGADNHRPPEDKAAHRFPAASGHVVCSRADQNSSPHEHESQFDMASARDPGADADADGAGGDSDGTETQPSEDGIPARATPCEADEDIYQQFTAGFEARSPEPPPRGGVYIEHCERKGKRDGDGGGGGARGRPAGSDARKPEEPEEFKRPRGPLLQQSSQQPRFPLLRSYTQIHNFELLNSIIPEAKLLMTQRFSPFYILYSSPSTSGALGPHCASAGASAGAGAGAGAGAATGAGTAGGAHTDARAIAVSSSVRDGLEGAIVTDNVANLHNVLFSSLFHMDYFERFSISPTALRLFSSILQATGAPFFVSSSIFRATVLHRLMATQFAFSFVFQMRACGMGRFLPAERFYAMLLAAFVLRIAHSGFPQQAVIQAQHWYSVLYNDCAPNTRFTSFLGWEYLAGAGVVSYLPPDQQALLRRHYIEACLSANQRATHAVFANLNSLLAFLRALADEQPGVYAFRPFTFQTVLYHTPEKCIRLLLTMACILVSNLANFTHHMRSPLIAVAYAQIDSDTNDAVQRVLPLLLSPENEPVEGGNNFYRAAPAQEVWVLETIVLPYLATLRRCFQCCMQLDARGVLAAEPLVRFVQSLHRTASGILDAWKRRAP